MKNERYPMRSDAALTGHFAGQEKGDRKAGSRKRLLAKQLIERGQRRRQLICASVAAGIVMMATAIYLDGRLWASINDVFKAAAPGFA